MDIRYSDRIAGLKPSAIREILKLSSDRSVIAFSAGNPAPEAFPTGIIRQITDDLLREDPILALQYSVTEGHAPLRDALRDFVGRRGIDARDENDLIILTGAQQGLELACKVLCNEGDTILCEDPTFTGALNAFRSYRTRQVGVPMEADGIDTGKLEEALRQNPRARFLYVIPNFQNPSGITMSLEKRRAVYALACKYNIVILEDNPYGDLRFRGEDIPSIKAMDREGRVIYLGSFSKLLSPGLRVGYGVGAPEILSKFVVAKQVSDVHTSMLSQLICERFMKTTDMDEHIAGLREIYRRKCGLMLSCMEEHFSKAVAFTRPEGGLFLWCTLPAGCDMPGFCKRAVAEYKVAVVPGTAFCADEEAPSQSFRVNFSTPTDENIKKGVEILGRLTRELA